jgi:hypothetical protein
VGADVQDKNAKKTVDVSLLFNFYQNPQNKFKNIQKKETLKNI